MENSIAKMRPALVAEWSEKNMPITPDDVSYGSNKLYWWKGSCGHEWQTSAKARAKGEGCPICSGARIVAGINDFETLHPKLAKEWSERNGSLRPSMVRPATHQKVWWRCKEGHEWEASVKSRTINKSGCPYCSHNKVLPGFNDLASRYPDVAKEWHYEKNAPLLPTQVTAFSNKKVWWKCNEGHEWYTHIATRSDGSKCPYCSGIELLKGFNDLQTRYPALCREWSGRNETLTPDMVNEKSLKNVWWKCQVCGHEYKAVIKSRVRGLQCPVCADRAIKIGYNDLETTHPEITSEWDHEKNRSLTSQMFSASSMKVVWWKCRNGHSWREKISERTMGESTCPKCEEEFASVFAELLILLHAKENDLLIRRNTEEISGLPLDVYLPDVNIAIDILEKDMDSRKRYQLNQFLCDKKGIHYGAVGVTNTVEKQAQQIRSVFKRAHLFLSGTEDTDALKTRMLFEKWRSTENKPRNIG